VIRETEGAIKDRKIYCGDNQLLKIHLLDTAVKTEIENNRCKLAKVSAKAHIDGAAALVDARTVRMKWADQYGYQLSNNNEN
jgi:phage terminase large subunit-like protein